MVIQMYCINTCSIRAGSMQPTWPMHSPNTFASNNTIHNFQEVMLFTISCYAIYVRILKQFYRLGLVWMKWIWKKSIKFEKIITKKNPPSTNFNDHRDLNPNSPAKSQNANKKRESHILCNFHFSCIFFFNFNFKKFISFPQVVSQNHCHLHSKFEFPVTSASFSICNEK